MEAAAGRFWSLACDSELAQSKSRTRTYKVRRERQVQGVHSSPCFAGGADPVAKRLPELLEVHAVVQVSVPIVVTVVVVIAIDVLGVVVGAPVDLLTREPRDCVRGSFSLNGSTRGCGRAPRGSF